MIRIAESWKFLLGIMDFGNGNPANYESELESGIQYLECGMWSVESKIQDGLRLTSSAQSFYLYLLFSSFTRGTG